jgi:hypothetical protein
VKHLDEGALRRLYDDPLAVEEPDRAHFAACEDCGRRFDGVAADARRAAGLLAVLEVRTDLGAALARFHEGRPAAPAVSRGRRVPWRPAAAAGLAAAAVLALAVTGTAQQLFTVLQPSSVQIVPVTTSELQSMPDLAQFGTVQWTGDPNLTPVADAAAAEAATGLSAPAPLAVPSGVPTSIAYAVVQQATATFTFSASKAQAWAAARGVSLPAMPAGMDGSSLELTVGPAIVEVYGGLAGSEGQIPKLVAGKMKSPVVQSTGPSVQEIEDYLTSIPSFPADLAAQIRALGDPTTTLPLPIPVDRASAQQADINGSQGVLVGDNTGLGAGAIWVRQGYVYGVAGTQPEDTILQLARSVH